ncbi:MAG: hypothetical protein K5629_02890 [Eubacteriales bacterium]|nr:hypothetical protein [Eubacteriales bacterium]
MKNEGVYADAALAACSAYDFFGYQIDLIDFLDTLGGADYEDRICPEYEIRELIAALKGCVPYRNSDSAEGINGIAVVISVRNMSLYTVTSKVDFYEGRMV